MGACGGASVSSRTGESVSTMRLEWACSELCSGADGSCAEVGADAAYFLSPPTGSLNLVIRPDVLAAGMRYTFSLSARERGVEHGAARDANFDHLRVGREQRRDRAQNGQRRRWRRRGI